MEAATPCTGGGCNPMYCNLICICTQRACARPSCQVFGAIRALLARATALSHVLSRRPSRRSVLSRTRLTRLRGTRSPRRRRESVLLCRMMPNPWASLRTPGPSLSAHRSACGFCATRSQLGSTCSAAMSKQPHELSSPSPCDPSNGTGGCVGAAAHRSAAVRCGCSGSSGSAGAATAWAGWLLSMARNASFVSIATIVERRKRSMLRRGRAHGPNSASFRSRVTGKTRRHGSGLHLTSLREEFTRRQIEACARCSLLPLVPELFLPQSDGNTCNCVCPPKDPILQQEGARRCEDRQGGAGGR